MKTPIVHLMDMMVGWFEFIEVEPDSYRQDDIVNQAYQFYQEAGYICGQKLSIEEEKEFVKNFLNDKVLPLILNHE